MGILGKIKYFASAYKFVPTREYNHILGDYQAIQKEFDRNAMNDNSRPTLPIPYIDTASGAKIPNWTLQPTRIYDMATEIGDLRIVYEIIQREMFKNGYEIKPKFKYKCGKCHKTFKDKPMSKFVSLQDKIDEGSASNEVPNTGGEDIGDKTDEPTNEGFEKKSISITGAKDIGINSNKPVKLNDAKEPKLDEEGNPIEEEEKLDENGEPIEEDSEIEPLECDECGNDDPNDFYKPKPENRVTLQALMSVAANNNNMTLLDMARIYERDLDIIDNAYCLVSKRYFLKPLETPDPLTGATMEVDEKKTEIAEFVPLHPMNIAKLANSEGRLGYDNQNKPVWICPDYNHRNKRLNKPVCDVCGCKAINAIIESSNIPYGLPISDPKHMMYGRDELVWTSGISVPNLLYGSPIILSIWKKAMSLFHQDEYIWKYFDKDRPPKSLLIFGTRNYESVQAFMERQKQGAKSDPYMPRPILVNAENAAQAAQFIDLTPNFKELELTELRKELRQIILTIHGLSPVSAGEQKGSGLGNEGLQLTLQNRTIKWKQSMLNQKFFEQITKRILKIDDWEIILVDSEEIDELRTEQIRGQKIDNASKMASMSYEHHTDGNGEFVFSQFPNPEKEAQSGGMGSNIKNGENDKVKGTKPPGEEQTEFGGQGKENRPSDIGGEKQGSPMGAGFSQSKKSLGEFGDVVEIINKGLVNKWTFTTMAKNVAKKTGWTVDESLDTITALISQKMEYNLQKTMSSETKTPKKYIIKDISGGKEITTVEDGKQ